MLHAFAFSRICLICIKILEMEFSHWCRLYSSRTHELRRTKLSMDQMAGKRRLSIQKVHALNNENSDIYQVLLKVIGIIFGDVPASNIKTLIDFDKNYEKTHSLMVAESTSQESLNKSLANQIRSKPIGCFSKEDFEFASIDSILHSNLWTKRDFKGHDMFRGIVTHFI